MFEFDEEKALRKLMSEADESERLASPAIESLKKVDERLRPYILAWLDGETPSFEFYGVSLEIIHKKEGGTFIDAIFRMDCILEEDDPEAEAKEYLERVFYIK